MPFKEKLLNWVKENVKLDVYNMLGKKISTLVDEKQSAGTYKYQFSAQDLGYSSGLYYLRIQINDRVFTKKLIEVKQILKAG